MADYEIEHETPEERKKREAAAKADKDAYVRARIASLRGGG